MTKYNFEGHQIKTKLQIYPWCFFYIFLAWTSQSAMQQCQFGCGILKMMGPKIQDFCPRINMVKGIFSKQSYNEVWFFKKCQNCTFKVNFLGQKSTEFFKKNSISIKETIFCKQNLFSNFNFWTTLLSKIMPNFWRTISHLRFF